MSEKTWKKTERAIATALNGQRVPVTGRQRGDAPDIAHGWLSIEVKHKKKLPNWLHDAMDQAEKSSNGRQLPIAVLHENGKFHDENFVVCRMGDFIDWFGDMDPDERARRAGL